IGAFFFQAEDGIRDLIVTGVQTCALPILLRLTRTLSPYWRKPATVPSATLFRFSTRQLLLARESLPLKPYVSWLAPRLQECSKRSEERRVGKECGAGWSSCS